MRPRYVGWVNPRTGEIHPRFRRPRNEVRKPVPGGRWEVRRTTDRFSIRPWQAKTVGKASYYNRRFATHAEAIAWAQRVAYWWRRSSSHAPKEQHATAILELKKCAREKYPNKDDAFALTPRRHR